MVLVIQEHSDNSLLEIFRKCKKRCGGKVADYVDSQTICFLQSHTRDGAIAELVNLLHQNGKIQERDIFHQAIKDREKIVSTGIGMGVAIPHAKLPTLEHFFISVGIQRPTGIHWESIDHAPVHLVFMIGGPEDKQDEYLHILSHLTMVMKEESLRNRLLHMSSSEEVFHLLQSF